LAKDLILIVEDNDLQRFVFKEMALKAGVQPHVVGDGYRAIELFTQNSYVAIFMDLTLLNMDGLECTRRIRKVEIGTFKHVPIIAITARSGEEARRQCLEAGMNDFLSKPFSFEQFVQKLERWRLHVIDPEDDDENEDDEAEREEAGK